MTRLINADALIEECNNVIEEVGAGELKEDYYDGYEAGVENIRDYAEHMPTIDAVPVRHGKWTVTPTHIKCSECGESFMLFPQNYCPNCGADMRGKSDE